MATLPIIYANLKEKFNSCDIILTEPLSYIKHLVLDNQVDDFEEKKKPTKVILFCKREYRSPNRNIQQLPSLSKNQASDTSRNDLNLMGSPLKDTCPIECIDDSLVDSLTGLTAWTDEEEAFTGIPLQNGQQMLSNVRMLVESEANSQFWVICGSNPSNILLTSMEINPEWNLRGIVTFNGIVAYEDINIASLQKKHLSYIPNHNGKIKNFIDTYFRVEDNNNIEIQLSRSTDGLLTNAVLTDLWKNARIILHQTVKINNTESIAEEFWRQLTILEIIKDNIVTYNESGCSSDLVYQVAANSETSLVTIKQEVYEVLIEIGAMVWQNQADENATNDIETVVERAKQRPHTEITDQLWTVLRRCSSYHDLKAAFEYVFTCAAKYNVVNLPTNHNRLAELIRDVSQHRIAIPHLNATEPLELLLEIGLDKLMRDYEFIFTESKLCSGNDLRAIKRNKKNNSNSSQYDIRKSLQAPSTEYKGSPEPAIDDNDHKTSQGPRKTLMHLRSTEDETNEPFGLKNSIFVRQDSEFRLAKLAQIHLTLDHLLLIHTNINLDNVYSTFLRDLQMSPKSFKWVKEQRWDKRAIVVSNEKILTKIDNESPYQQRFVLSSENKMCKVQNTFYYAMEPIFPPDVFACMQPGETTRNKYYSHHYLHIGTQRK